MFLKSHLNGSISFSIFTIYNFTNLSLDYHSLKINLQEPGPLENAL